MNHGQLVRQQPRTYTFIDGGYLEARYRDRIRAFYGVDGEIDYQKFLGRPDVKGIRIFYYNGLDDEPREGETAIAVGERVKDSQQRFDRIQFQPDVHVRLGSVSRAVRRPESRKQKEVDISIAVDMLTHSHNRNMDEVRFVAGDLDFAPLVAAVVRTGVRVTIIYDQRSIARELLREADHSWKLQLDDYFRMSSRAFWEAGHVPPAQRRDGFLQELPSYQLLRSGRHLDQEVLLIKAETEALHESAGYRFVLRNPDGQDVFYADADLKRLNRFIESDYPNLRWEPSEVDGGGLGLGS